jgi:hypothetical protein
MDTAFAISADMPAHDKVRRVSLCGAQHMVSVCAVYSLRCQSVQCTVYGASLCDAQLMVPVCAVHSIRCQSVQCKA